MTNSEWLDLKAKLLYESGMTLREMCKFFGGVSHQRIQQRLKKIGYEVRGVRGHGHKRPEITIYMNWQKTLVRRLRDLGLSFGEIDYLLSFPNNTSSRMVIPDAKRELRGRVRGHRELKINLVHSAWIEARNNILLHARANGATFEEIAELAGFNKPEIALIALRRHRKGKRVSQ